MHTKRMIEDVVNRELEDTTLEEMLEDFDLTPSEVFWILIKLGHIDMELFDKLYGESYE